MTNKSTPNSVSIVIPVHNESKVIGEVITSIKKDCADARIIIIDDGSTDNTYDVISRFPVEVYRHIFCCGKGAAVKTGIAIAMRSNSNVVVTMDGDGQHDSRDINPMLNKIDQGYKIVLGSRMLISNNMPIWKMMANKLANFAVYILYHVRVSDSQSGFRAYQKDILPKIMFVGEDYEFDSEVLREVAKYNISFAEVPIRVRYTPYSQEKTKKQGLIQGVKTIINMFIHS